MQLDPVASAQGRHGAAVVTAMAFPALIVVQRLAGHSIDSLALLVGVLVGVGAIVRGGRGTLDLVVAVAIATLVTVLAAAWIAGDGVTTWRELGWLLAGMATSALIVALRRHDRTDRLARQLGVERSVVVEARHQLRAENEAAIERVLTDFFTTDTPDPEAGVDASVEEAFVRVRERWTDLYSPHTIEDSDTSLVLELVVPLIADKESLAEDDPRRDTIYRIALAGYIWRLSEHAVGRTTISELTDLIEILVGRAKTTLVESGYSQRQAVMFDAVVESLQSLPLGLTAPGATKWSIELLERGYRHALDRTPRTDELPAEVLRLGFAYGVALREVEALTPIASLLHLRAQPTS